MVRTNPISEAMQQEHLAMIDDFVLDCLLSDNHQFESEVTEFPVESGSVISDNIRTKPLVVSIEAIVSNTGLSFADSKRVGANPPADDAYDLLLSIRRDRRLVSITTSVTTYKNMALESFSIPRASGRGDELRFNATFKQVEIVTNKRDKRVAIPTAQSHTAVSTFTTTQVVGTGFVYLNASNGAWYDDAISAWRLSSEVVQGRWLLTRSRPLDIPIAKWNVEPISQHIPSVLRPRMIALQGGKARPFLYKIPLKSVFMLKPGGYVIQELTPIK